MHAYSMVRALLRKPIFGEKMKAITLTLVSIILSSAIYANAPKAVLSWDTVHDDCRELAKKIKESKLPLKGLIVVSRGGMGPGLMLSHLLPMQNIQLVAVKSYSGKSRGNLELITHPEADKVGDGEGWLIVDDLLDSGKTVEYLQQQHFPKAQVAVVYVKPSGKKLIPDAIYVREFTQDTWIDFPWEVDPV